VEEITSRSSFDGMVTANQSIQAVVEAGYVNLNRMIGVSLKPK
jgi:twitching motility protein PilT